MLFVGKNIYVICWLGGPYGKKTLPEFLSTVRGRRPRAVLKTKGTVFSHTDRPSPANSIFIFSGHLLFKVGKEIGIKDIAYVASRMLKDPVLPIVHCTLPSLGGHFCDVENSEAFVCGENRTL